MIIGNVNAISYKEIFQFIKDDKIWLGYNCVRMFQQPNGKLFETARTFWFTNLDIPKRHEHIILYRNYNEVEYPKYDNYDAINVNKTSEIPCDYEGAMGVPITFLDKYNPEQFEISGIDRYIENNPNYGKRFSINKKEIYARIIIKNKFPSKGKK